MRISAFYFILPNELHDVEGFDSPINANSLVVKSRLWPAKKQDWNGSAGTEDPLKKIKRFSQNGRLMVEEPYGSFHAISRVFDSFNCIL
jgi:hypothetical protein